MQNNLEAATSQADFIEHIASLAGEGETALVLRQKPYLVEGAPQFYANGGIKATWPAYLPTHKVNPAWSVFMNTASFIVDRFKDGHPSASAANCEFVLVMMLDDIGTPKAKTPPIEPSWILETSEGCFQWGYIFSEQPRKGEYCAAWAAIAAAGYTDPGAGNAVRNFRIPGSVNLKPERKGFVSRLVEWHPEREFTLDQLCAAFGVTPGEAQSTYNPIRLADDGSDDVLAFLNDHGLVASAPNHEGWLSVICPNAEKHSDGSPVGRYLPSTRSYCCFHSSCVEINSAEFLSWVEAQGGPKHDAGLRDDLLANVMKGTLDKLTPTAAYPDEAAKIVAELDRREAGRVEKSEWYARFAYVLPEDSYFDLVTRDVMTRRGFDSTFRHVECRSIHGEKKIKCYPSIAYDESRQANGARILHGLTYVPGESSIVERNGKAYGNRWQDARVRIEVAGDPTLWIDHCKRLVPDPDQLNHCWDVMAYKLRNPSIKINHAVLHGSDERVGKDTMWAPFRWALGGGADVNVAIAGHEQMDSQWGYHYESELLILNELKESEARERRALANKLKPVIAAPPDTLTVNRKGLHPFQAANRLFVLAFTNHTNAISLESQDGRWYCIWSYGKRMEPEDGAAFWAWLRTGGGFEACAAWLWKRDVSAFMPGAPALMTDMKQNMIESSLSPVESSIVRLIETGQSDFAKGVVASPWQGVADRISGQVNSLSGAAAVRVHPNALLHALKESGWIDCGRIGSTANQTKKHVFCNPSMLRYTKSDLRDIVEPPALVPPDNVIKMAK